jgi:hypothetical protein
MNGLQFIAHLLAIFCGQERFEGHRFTSVGLMSLIDDSAMPRSRREVESRCHALC